MHRNIADGSPLRKCQSCTVNGREWTGANGGLAQALPNKQPEQSIKPSDGVVANCEEGSKSSRRRNFFQTVENVILNRSIPHSGKVTVIHDDLREFLDVEDREAEGASDNLARKLEHAAQDEIAKWKNEYRAMRLAKSLVQEAHAALQNSFVKMRANTEKLQKRFVEMRAENENLRSKPVCQELNVATAAVEDSGNLGDRGLVKQVTESEILAQILSLTLELQKRSQEHESPRVNVTAGIANGDDRKNSQELEPGEAANGVEQRDVVCGSYTDDFATPNLLDVAFSTSKAAVTNLQKAFFDVKGLNQDNRWDMPELDTFARPKHTAYWVKSALSFIFYDGFENESFDTAAGVPKYLDPDLRQARFYEDYCKGNASKDPQFEEFCEMKGSEVLRRIGPPYYGETAITCLENIGGPQLCSSFIAAARSVWLLHKLAFSFESPAFIFRVERDADLDPNYMKTPGSFDDDRFVAKVGFMITPGLRLRKSVMPCEIYPLSAAVPAASS